MSFNYEWLLEPWIVFWVIFASTVVVFAILTILERRTLKELRATKEIEKRINEKIVSIQYSKESPEKILEEINNFAPRILAEKFGIDGEVKDYELIESFRKIGREKEARFCEAIQISMFSGEQLTRPKIDRKSVV